MTKQRMQPACLFVCSSWEIPARSNNASTKACDPFKGYREVAGARNLHSMNPYMLILVAKHNDDDTYQYSTQIFPAKGMDCDIREKSFASETEFKQHVNAALGGGGDLNNVFPRLQREGSFMLDGIIKMSDDQAAQFGWTS
jgi:hypothetical protein